MAQDSTAKQTGSIGAAVDQLQLNRLTPSLEDCSPQPTPVTCHRCKRELNKNVHTWIDRQGKKQTTITYDDEKYCRRCSEELGRINDLERCVENGGTFLFQELRGMGIGPHYIRDGNPPSLTDSSLSQYSAARAPLNRGIIAVGPVGTHKTHLLTARTFASAMNGKTVQIINWTYFCLEVRDTYKNASKVSEQDILKKYSKMDYLAIDDLGVGKSVEGKESEASRVLCYLLLDYRYSNALVTDASANLTPEELESRFDDRIGRRLREMCDVFPMI